MARIRIKGNSSFAGYGLKPSDDVKLVKILNQKELSAKKLVRALLKEWIDKQI